MATISAADVAKLRKVTLAGMMDCKKALEESGGDFDKAVEIIRKKDRQLPIKEPTGKPLRGLSYQEQGLIIRWEP